MSRLTGAFLLLCLHAGFAYGMDCSLGRSSNFIEKVVNTCPGILDSRSKSYCCYDIPNDTAYCCDAEEFALKTGLGIIVPAIITAEVQAPNVVHVVQTPANLPPSYASQGDQVQNHYVPYPTNPAGFPQHPPPQYNEAYAKQAPYNPAYPPQ